MSARPAHTALDFAAFMRERRAEYGRDLPCRVRGLCEAVERLAAGKGDRAVVEREAHALAGSAGTFGFGDVGRAARAIELAVSGPPAALASLCTHLRLACPPA